jgi:fluoroquinolone transport system permease protein
MIIRYWRLLQFELKAMLRDAMNVFMLVYPLIMIVFVGYLIPLILVRSGVDSSSADYALSMLIVFVFVLCIGGFISGALLGFSLLENKDDQTIKAIALSPITLRGYTLFKSIYVFIFGLIGNLVFVLSLQSWFADAFNFSYAGIQFGLNELQLLDVIAFAFVTSLFTPTAGTLIAAIAKNKIEGFAFMKTAGIVVLIPALILMTTFQDGKQFLLGLSPNFWPVKAMMTMILPMNHAADLPYYVYLTIGSVYMVVIGYMSLEFFIKRATAERG